MHTDKPKEEELFDTDLIIDNDIIDINPDTDIDALTNSFSQLSINDMETDAVFSDEDD